VHEVDIGRRTGAPKESALKQMDEIGRALRFIPHLFEKIQIDTIRVGGETAHLLFYDDIFYIRTDTLQLATQLLYNEERKTLFAKIDTLYLVGPKLLVKGRFAYEPATGVWRGDGTYDGLGVTGRFTVWHKNDTVGFRVDSDPTDSIKALVDYLAPPEPVKVWIYPKIPAQKYVLHYLKGEVRLKKEGGIVFDPDKVEGFATAYDAKVFFHPKVPPVHVPKIDVTYRNDTLAFKLYDPVYEGKRLDGSYVRIRNLTSRRGRVELDAHIVVDARFDESIRKILLAYRIPVPFVQTKGRMQGVTDLTVALKTGRIVRYAGDYRAKRAVLLFDRVLPVPVDDLHVVAEGLRFRIEPCRISLAPYLDAGLSGTLDLAKKRGDFDLSVRRLELSAGKTPLIAMRNTALPVGMDFKKEILFTLPSMAAKLRYLPGGGAKVTMKDLKRLAPFFRGPLAPIRDGSLEATLKKGRLTARAELLYPNRILLRRGRPVERLRFVVTADAKETDLTLNDRLRLRKKGDTTTIRYKDFDINVINLRTALQKYLVDTSGNAKRGKKAPSQIVRIEAEASTLYTNYVRLPCDSYEVKMTTSPYSVLFESKHRAGTIYAILYGDDMKIVGKNLPDTVIHGIPALEDLYGGSFDFDAVGKTGDFKGTITFRNTLWAKSAVYNNILATINTIPSLLTLKSPGFNEKGFKIKKGAIAYHYKKPLFTFDKISIYGESANIFGQGSIDFAKSWIDVAMKIQFLRSVSSTVHKIPAVGYILLGDDGTISLGLDVEGPLQKPKVKTTAAKDIVSAPLNILKRTITFPFHLFK